jgi:hypothetical protein
MQIDAATAISQFVGSLPTFVAVLLAWLNSNKRIDDVRDLIKAESDTIRAEMRRMEDVMDARLKHLEENK